MTRYYQHLKLPLYMCRDGSQTEGTSAIYPIAVITPSYEPDFELCKMLHESLLAMAPPSTIHYIISPDRDFRLFSRLCGERCVVLPESELLPRRFITVPGINMYINARRPFPPIRGWIVQQIIKLAAAARIASRTLLLVDSDIVFIRPFSADTFYQDGVLRFFHKTDAIDESLPRHLAWHRVARTLLGLPPAVPPLPDYVSSLSVWDHKNVCAVLKRIEEVSGREWIDIIGSQLHFSEFILYGVFVEKMVGTLSSAQITDSMQVLSYWDTVPLGAATVGIFLEGISDTDIALMISSKSGTPLEIRRAALEILRSKTSPT